MSALDGGLILIAVLGAAVGWNAGFFLGAAYTAAGIVASWTAAAFAPSLGFYISGHTAVAYGIIFLCVACTAAAGAYFLNALTAFPLVNAANKGAGTLAGAVMGLVIAVAGFFPFLASHSPAFKPLAEKSRLIPLVDRLVDKTLHEWPAEFKKRF